MTPLANNAIHSPMLLWVLYCLGSRLLLADVQTMRDSMRLQAEEKSDYRKAIDDQPSRFGSAISSDLDNLHDLIPSFRQYLSISAGKSNAKRVELFKERVVPTYPEFYEAKFSRWKKNKVNVDANIIDNIEHLLESKERFESVAQGLRGNLEKSIESFKKSFPDMRFNFPIYLLYSLGEMNGGTRTFGGKLHLLFGIDGITLFRWKNQNQIPFFHHELFHVYHYQKGYQGEKLSDSLWTEGLATYVSKKLNPKASNQELLLDDILIREGERKRDRLREYISARLEVESETDYSALFLMDSKHEWIPERAGYYLGYLVAKDVNERIPLEKMVSLKSDQALIEMRKALKNIASTNQKTF